MSEKKQLRKTDLPLDEAGTRRAEGAIMRGAAAIFKLPAAETPGRVQLPCATDCDQLLLLLRHAGLAYAWRAERRPMRHS